MATRFRMFQTQGPASAVLIEDANKAIAEIERSGGRYVNSHWSTEPPLSDQMVGTTTLVLVYEEAESSENTRYR